tara:strand:+ start:407 stop:781 length:375 start_codon:yes stop_codon:yes gene_type:complete
MDDLTGRPDHIEDVLVKLHTGQWFGWSDSKDKVYSNIVIHDDQYSKPSKASLESGLVQAQDDFDWQDVRNKRDAMLRDSDRVMLSDYPIHEVGRTEYESFRQELRDIPESFASADLVEFPNEPS